MADARVWPQDGATDIEHVAVDWSAYRKCPVCGALLGQQCRLLSGLSAGLITALDQAHVSRPLRAGRAVAGG